MENKSLSELNKDCWYHGLCLEEHCEDCTRYYIIKKLMYNANVPRQLHHPITLKPTNEHDFESFSRLNDIKTDVEEFIENGKNLYICSEHTGNGKTSWALKIMFKFFSLSWDNCDWTESLALYIYVPEFIMALKDFNNPLSKKYLENVKNVPLVIWDDIGMGSLTAYDYGQFAIYLNYRVQVGLSNIFTSNFTTLEQLSGAIGDKLASRVYNTSEIIELEGRDMR